MISWANVYHVVVAIVPLYVTMILAFVSVKWWKLFSPEQCSGINKFVAKFSIPLLSFQVISSNNIYNLNLKLLCADFIQKLIAFVALISITKLSSRGGLRWIITGLSLTTLPNTLILGIPLLKAMYGEKAVLLLAQIVVIQSTIWYNLLLFLYELENAKSITDMTPTESTGDVAVSHEDQDEQEGQEAQSVRASRHTALVILLIVGKKLITNPNTHATILGLIWACIHFKWGVDMPEILKQSILLLANGGLGMAMFSLGLFMASLANGIAFRTRTLMVAMGLKFVVGPALMAVASLMIRLKGTVFQVAIVQTALPQGIVPFVFAKEYGVHPDILSTGVILGMLIAMPVTLVYYFLLAL